MTLVWVAPDLDPGLFPCGLHGFTMKIDILTSYYATHHER